MTNINSHVVQRFFSVKGGGVPTLLDLETFATFKFSGTFRTNMDSAEKWFYATLWSVTHNKLNRGQPVVWSGLKRDHLIPLCEFWKK